MQHERNFPTISADDLADIGTGNIAYMRKITGEEIRKAFPDQIDIHPEAKVWALFAADGTPLALSGDEHGARSSALANDLVTVAVN